MEYKAPTEMDTFLPQDGSNAKDGVLSKYKVQVAPRDIEVGQGDGKSFDPFNERKVDNPTTDGDTLTHLLKAALGTGILSMPIAFKNAGLVVGVFATVLVAFVCTHCAYILVKCAHVLYYKTRRTEMSFADVAEVAFATGPQWGRKFSKPIRYLIQISLFATYFGTCSVYTVIVAANFNQIIKHYHAESEFSLRLMATCLLIPLILLSWIPNLKYLAPVSMVANIFMGSGLGITFYYLVRDMPSINSVPLFASIQDFPRFFSITIFAMEAIGVVMPLENNMKTPQHFVGICGVLNKGMSGVTFIYILLGFLGYVRYQDQTLDSITLNLPTEEVAAQIVKILIALAVYCTFGLQFYVCLDIAWNGIKDRFQKKPLLANYILRTAMVTGAVLLAVIVPTIEPFIGLIGAFCFSILGLLIPVFVETVTYWDVGFGPGNWVALKNADIPDANDEDNKTDKKDDHEMIGVCEHPLSDLVIAGESVNPLPTVFHTLLQTIADLMLLPPPGSPLQQAAIRCWGIKFTPADHMFLHRSHVFSNISKILSRSEEEEDLTVSMHESHQSIHSQQVNSCVEVLKDLTSGVEIKASSRQAMIGSLTDNSTETFWESGDEDRNKTKTITIICGAHSLPRMVYIHIDNCRDLTHKVSSITFQSGNNVDEMVKLRTEEIESRSAGWISCPVIDPRHVIVGLKLKGPDNSLRVRQIRILGEIEGESLKIGKQLNTQTIQQRNCEAETLKVFRLITSQVFGKLIQGEQAQQQMDNTEGSNEDLDDSNDLREHMVGILFSRNNLTHLQKQVCTHIVQAIQKETIRLREEWEVLLCSPTPANSLLSDNSDLPKAADTYCFEMLSMVLALSGSSVGQYYLSHQYGLLKDLLSLLHTGSARVQRQVTSLLKRILPEIKPEILANVVSVKQLPPTDFSIVSAANNGLPQTTEFDEHSPGILDVFLSCIAKALTVQVKVKGKENGKALQTASLATSIHPKSQVGARWWLRGCMTRKLAEVIIQLLKDMASGKLSEAWASVTKAAIAENILNLTRLDEKSRDPAECLKTPTLWLALSSLCVLDSDHVERLSSGQWRGAEGQPPPPRPKCSNHDDGETTAIIQCNVCGNLCAECDRILHLHRRTRMHIRQVCKEEEEAIRVDLHEGCGRTKLFWILALADSRTLKALVEFRDGSSRKPIGATSGMCRFCGTTGNTGLLAVGNICADHDCQEHGKNACSKVHVCGHICGGVRNENICLPCLHRCLPGTDLKQDADDMCMICFTEALSAAPAIQLQCGHVFHLHCCRHVLMKRWVGPRITFGFSLCPICKVPMEHPTLADQLASIKELYEDVRRKALMRLEYEGLHKTEAAFGAGGRYHQDPAAYAMERYAYYVCYKCQKAYYGGEARCDAQVGGETFDPTELVCGGCSDVARAQMCPKHGADFLEYKCRYCCSVAVFFCFGTTHFCNPCHDDFQRVTTIPKSDLPSCPAGPKAKQLEGDECPLHVKHPPTGEEFALGCGICRNAHTF